MENWKFQPLVNPAVIRSPFLSPARNLSYSFPILKLTLPNCAVLPGIIIIIVIIIIIIIIIIDKDLHCV